MLEGIRNDALVFFVGQAYHGVRFTAAGLAISKDSAVVAANDRLYKRKGSLVVDCPLGRVYTVDCVISENFLIGTTFFLGTDNHLVRWLVDTANALAA